MESFKQAIEECYRVTVQINKEVNIEFDLSNFSKPNSVDYFNDKEYLKKILPPLQGVHTFTNSTYEDIEQFEEEFNPDIDDEDEFDNSKTNTNKQDTTLTASKDDLS